ncbi:C-terminal helicase domain-containing protein [Paraburkholderia caballeronis]|uniref:C-terminal helicase domain-containing protein n=1 Tax=Paraburkholderia caballeronis TaxID=416943 RepID=UPI001064DE9C|nr:helicase-related protein [Paraburkholderia caballeronis]TDV01937.1 helicase-like protein [Paraburkholderia caballeronis]TDV06179.1 helicase-like protein [Paraburkholderia caballeronis]TDV16098.1 helicase-like protein [Paraburkholderia caballeronis]
MTRNIAASTFITGLKDFQKMTVDYVFERMFDDAEPAMRFLVADEVGLGKTMIAKGVIAKTIDKYAQAQKRIDIVYVCSNAEIAAQNIRRLLLPGQSNVSKANRLTLLPKYTHELDNHAVNLISFTPTVAFGTKNGGGLRTGRKEERHLIYQMLRTLQGVREHGLRRALRATAGDTWDVDAQQQIEGGYDETIASAFRNNILLDEALYRELCEIAELCADRRRKITEEVYERCKTIIGDLRRLLSRTCLVALKPALVILDEFQRFNDLFDDPDETDNPAAELAHQLFNYEGRARVLLLSATPYKMYARDDESEDHYTDFLRTLQFLYPGEPGKIDALKSDIGALRTGLLSARGPDDLAVLAPVKARIEQTLRHVMCRTERVEATLRADAMVKDQPLMPCLCPGDLADFRSLEALANTLKEPDTIEYWKSSPYLLNFMSGYRFKKSLEEEIKPGRKLSPVHEVLVKLPLASFDPRDVEHYRVIDPGNARLRALIGRIDRDGLWKLLWMPPSLGYWKAGGEYEGIGAVSKQLVFSAWNVVPDALAAILSFEAERRLVEHFDRRASYAGMVKRFGPRLQFKRSGNEPAGMATMLLAFPSQALTSLIDPLALLDDVDSAPCYADIHKRAMEIIEVAITPFVEHRVNEGPFDRRWYWVTLARLEASRHPEARAWCEHGWTVARSLRENMEDDSSSAFDDHVVRWLEAWDGEFNELGRVPDDLATVLAHVALNAPATCALRTLMRRWTHDQAPEAMLSAAARIAEGMRSQFNSPRAVALLKAVERDEDSYWQRVLQYSADGNLQALLDEYVHILFDANGLAERPVDEGCQKLGDAMFEAMSLRSATQHPDEVKVQDDLVSIKPFETGIRTHFALRFGQVSEDDGAVTRKKTVQAAFNSPFWPFVLTSTSIGQEGLDFHHWCHSVMHWNLPSNPVDMEQREGRVHRYKGYAVRKNVALRHGHAALQCVPGAHGDVWSTLFDLAVESRPANANDLIPFWIYEVEGGSQIERTVMALPLSRDEARYRRLKRSLALYRLVFAQPRQEDLLSCLERAFDSDSAARTVGQWRISLSPKPRKQ